MGDDVAAVREGRGAASRAARPVLGVVLLVVLGVTAVLLPRQGGGGGGAVAATPSSAGVMPSETPSTPPGEATWCASYLAVADVQAQFASDPTDGQVRRLLEDVAGDLIATGVPSSMGPLARAGYLTEISGIYESLGEKLDRRAVPGALADVTDGTSVSGPAGAFGTWLSQACPA